MEIPIPDDWDGLSTCRWAVCWPNSIKWRAILSGLIEEPVQGRFWDFETGNFLSLRESFRPIYDYNFNLRSVIMACNDNGLLEIADALKALASANGANASASASCVCGGANGYTQGAVSTPGGTSVPLYGSQPPLSLPGDVFPPGYDNWDDVYRDKCAIATGIVNGWIDALRYLQAADVFQLTAIAGLIGASLAGVAPALVFPPAAIVILVTSLGFLAGAMYLLGELRGYLEDRKDEVICLLYTSNSVSAIVASLSGLLDTFIALFPAAEPLSIAIKAVALALVNVDTLNTLFTLRGAGALPDGECTNCGGECTYDFSETVQDWSWSAPEGATEDTYGIWSDTFNSEGALVSQISTNADTGVASILWTSPYLSCAGNQVRMSVGANFSGVGGWTLTASYVEGGNESQFFGPTGGPTIYAMSIDPEKTVNRITIEYSIEGASPGYTFSVIVYNVVVETV